MLVSALVALAGCAQYVFEGSGQAAPCEPEGGAAKACADLVGPLAGSLDRAFVAGYSARPALENASVCDGAERELAGSKGCTPEALAALRSRFVGEAGSAVAEAAREAGPLLSSPELASAAACKEASCVHRSLLAASRALAISELAQAMANGTAPPPERVAALTRAERELLVGSVTLMEANLTAEAERLRAAVRASGQGRLDGSSPREAFSDGVRAAEGALAEEEGRLTSVVATRAAPAALAGLALALAAVLAYERKYRAQVEFWKTFTSSTDIARPRSVALAALGASAIAAAAGAVLLILGRG